MERRGGRGEEGRGGQRRKKGKMKRTHQGQRALGVRFHVWVTLLEADAFEFDHKIRVEQCRPWMGMVIYLVHSLSQRLKLDVSVDDPHARTRTQSE